MPRNNYALATAGEDLSFDGLEFLFHPWKIHTNPLTFVFEKFSRKLWKRKKGLHALLPTNIIHSR